MADIDEDIGDGDIHLRDKFQFEVKSEYSPVPGQTNNTYTLEFYFFIPTALHVNKHTYAKKHFYYDQTSLIRLKTPHVPLPELIDTNHPHSPLSNVRQSYADDRSPPEKDVLKDLKLYANMARSDIRDRSLYFIEALKHQALNPDRVYEGIEELCHEIISLRASYHNFMAEFAERWRNTRLVDYAQYIDEFISLTVDQHLTSLLHALQQYPESPIEQVTERILWESTHRANAKERSPYADDPEKNMEYFVYRSGLLKKFVWEALFLNIIRKEPAKPFREFAAMVAAGLAMLIYVFFLTWQLGGSQPGGIIVNSTAFIMLSVFLYIIKDRFKDGLKNLSATFAARWFPDYRTHIETPDGETKLGYLKEYFSFLTPKEVPPKIIQIRNTGFHTELERAERLENVFFYKKEVVLFAEPEENHHRAPDLNDIMRYNIARFLLKASDAYKEYLEVDVKTGKLHVIHAPKVYHINIIMRRTFRDMTGEPHSDLRKFRIVVDKEGIKRVEKML